MFGLLVCTHRKSLHSAPSGGWDEWIYFLPLSPMWKNPGDPKPHDGWYNGNIDLLMINGTYGDFRQIFVDRVAYGKLKQKDLDAYDKRWEAISLEERLTKRAQVVEDSTPKPVIELTSTGPKTIMKAKPSNNGAAEKASKDKFKRRASKVVKGRAKGALTEENNPLTKK